MNMRPSISGMHFYRTSSPITLSYMGLCVPVLMMPCRVDMEYFTVPHLFLRNSVDSMDSAGFHGMSVDKF